MSSVIDPSPLTADFIFDENEPLRRLTDHLESVGHWPLIISGPAKCGKSLFAKHLLHCAVGVSFSDTFRSAPLGRLASPGASNRLDRAHRQQGLSNTLAKLANGTVRGERESASERRSKHSNDRRRSIPLVLTGQEFRIRRQRAIETRTMSDWLRSLHSCSGLLIDDFHTLAGSPQTQDEIASLIDRFSRRGTPVILVSELPTWKMDFLAPRLLSRLSSGLSVQIGPPGPRARTVLLRQWAAQRSVYLSEEVIKLISLEQSIPWATIVAELPALLEASLGGAEPEINGKSPAGKARNGALLVTQGPTVVAAWLRSLRSAAAVTLSMAAKFVAQAMGVTITEMRGTTRQHKIVLARGVLTLIARRDLNASWAAIAKYLSRDPATLRHAYSKTVERSLEDPRLNQVIAQISSQVFAQATVAPGKT